MSVQDILMQQVLRDNQAQPDPAVAMGVGATGGALAGIAAGHLPQVAAQGVARMLPPVKSSQSMAQAMRGRIRPGFRAAGGLLGAIAGGALGAGAANMMRTSSPAGEMLARIQATGGELTSIEQMQLQQILADAYNNMGR